MRSVIARIGNALLLLAFLGLLGWGGLQAQSADAALSGTAVAANHCGPDAIGHCTDQEDCETDCQQRGFTTGNCVEQQDPNCCFCLE